MSNGKSGVIVPPPVVSQPMTRPGISESKSIPTGRCVRRPGFIDDGDDNGPIQMGVPPGEEDNTTVEDMMGETHPASEPEAKPKPKKEPPPMQPAPEVAIPLHGGHPTAVGMWVSFWMTDPFNRHLIEIPAQLLRWHPEKQVWSLNLMQPGRIASRHEVNFSDGPKNCCWTWPKPVASAVKMPDGVQRSGSAGSMLPFSDPAKDKQIADLKATVDGLLTEFDGMMKTVESLRAELAATKSPPMEEKEPGE